MILWRRLWLDGCNIAGISARKWLYNVYMNKTHVLSVLIILVLVAGCSGGAILRGDSGEETLPAGSNCLEGEAKPVGKAIASEYDFANYDQVMTWFCDGAEFEDILVALETESQTEVPAEEMLEMLVEGFTWDEIWGLIGLSE